MNDIKTIGVIGTGFVGTALLEGMKHAFNIETYDKNKIDESTQKSISDIVTCADTIFVCVPTPMLESGEAYIGIVKEVLEELAFYVEMWKSNDLVVAIKSTIPPGTTDELQEYCDSELTDKYARMHLVFQPEFLTEANFIDDFKNQSQIVIGTQSITAAERMNAIYKKAYPNVKRAWISSKEAEMVKYTTNVFLAVKVSLANEIYQICSKLDISYDTMINVAKNDKRLGSSHWKVPGPMLASDGSGRTLPGFSGSCFCKDINGLMHAARELGIDPKVMKAAWDKNLEVRPERDWEKLHGRAVIKKIL